MAFNLFIFRKKSEAKEKKAFIHIFSIGDLKIKEKGDVEVEVTFEILAVTSHIFFIKVLFSSIN